MSLFLFLIVAISLACGSAEPHPVPLSLCLGGSAALLVLWMIVAEIAVRHAIGQSRSAGNSSSPRRLHRRLDTLRWLAIPAAMVCLLAFGLAAAMQSWPLVAQSMTLQAITLLAPGHLFLAVTLWAEHRYEVATGAAVAGCGVSLRRLARSLMQAAGWLVAPIGVLLAAADLLAWLPGTERLPAGAALGLLTLLTLPVIVPWLARRLWSTRPLDEPHRRWLTDLVAAAGAPGLNVRLWETGGRSCNAVVIGFFPSLRTLLLTDRLVRELTPEQLQLIVLHEVAHIRRRHMGLRMLAVVPGWVLAAGILHLCGSEPLWLLISNAAAITITLLMLRLSAHATEFDADQAACELAIEVAASPSWRGRERLDARTAAEIFSEALRRIECSEGAGRHATWLHPSVQSREVRLRVWAAGMLQPSGPSALTG